MTDTATKQFEIVENPYDIWLIVEDESKNMALYIFGEEFVKVQRDGKVFVRGEQVDDNREIYKAVKEALAKLFPADPLP